MPTKKSKQKEVNILKRLGDYEVLNAWSEDGTVSLEIDSKCLFYATMWSKKSKDKALKEISTIMDALSQLYGYVDAYEVEKEESIMDGT